MERGRLAATLCPAGARAAADRASPSMLRRVRWGNVGRLAALVAAAVLIIGGDWRCGAAQEGEPGAGRTAGGADLERLEPVRRPAPRRDSGAPAPRGESRPPSRARRTE